MKTLAILILVILYTSSINAQSPTSGIIWGESPENIISEDDPNLNRWISTDNMKIVKTTIYGLKAIKIYYFQDNELIKVSYIIKENKKNSDDYLTYYNQFNNKLSNKYGKAEYNKRIWTNNIYRNNIEDHDLAVSSGHLEIKSEYNAGHSTIRVLLNGDNFETKLEIQFVSNVHIHKEDQIVERPNILLL